MTRIIPMLPALLLISNCAAATVPKEQYFRLIADSEPPALEAPLDGSVEVAPFSSEGILRERPLLFTANGGQNLEQRNYAYWVDSPPSMVRSELIAYLRAAGVAKQVLASELRADTAYLIQGSIRRLEQTVGGRNGGAIEIELSLIKKSTDALVISAIYKFDEQVAGDSIDDAVSTLNREMNEAFASFVADIAKRS